jgi:hypothetical protein
VTRPSSAWLGIVLVLVAIAWAQQAGLVAPPPALRALVSVLFVAFAPGLGWAAAIGPGDGWRTLALGTSASLSLTALASAAMSLSAAWSVLHGVVLLGLLGVAGAMVWVLRDRRAGAGPPP